MQSTTTRHGIPAKLTEATKLCSTKNISTLLNVVPDWIPQAVTNRYIEEVEAHEEGTIFISYNPIPFEQKQMLTR